MSAISSTDHRPQLPKYELLEEVGHGGMATVYRAHDKRLGRDVAIKVIHRHLRENREVAARFVSEARAVAKLRHPNIVEVYDVSEEDDDERYLVVELVRGITLRRHLQIHTYMPAEVAVAVALEIGAALGHAHEHGVVHRDVKPENVLLDLPGEQPPSNRDSQERTGERARSRIKITDFGIAKLLDAQGVTSTGQVLGSPAHMAPEQIEGGDVTPAADVFALGVLLYECLVGRLPFDGKNPAQVLRKVLDGQFTPADRARPTVGAEWARIVAKSLERRAEDRYQSADEFMAALREELDSLGFGEPKHEIAEYLADPKAYFVAYQPRVVKRLIELGKQAKSERQTLRAAGCFNRALAFRPDDAELLRYVTGLARAERLRKSMLQGGLVVGVTLVLGASAYGISRAVQKEGTPAEAENGQRGQSNATPITREPRAAPVKPKGSAGPQSSGEPLEVDPKPKALKLPVKPVGSGPLVEAGAVQDVKIVVSGPKNSTVTMDGNPINWYEPQLQLSVGVHTFEAIPPNNECCIRKPAKSIRVEKHAGVMTIALEAPYRDAVLDIQQPRGWTLRCGSVVMASPIPFRGSIPMSVPDKLLTCTASPPASNPNQSERTIPLTLKAGETTSP